MFVTTRKRTTSIVALAAMSVSILSGCGAKEPEDPKAGFAQSFTSISEGKEMSMVYDLDATAGQFTEAMQKASGGKADTDSLDSFSRVLADTTVQMDMESRGDTLAKEKDFLNKVDMTININVGGEAPIVLTQFAGDYGLKVDTKGLGEVTGAWDRDQVYQMSKSAATEWQQDLIRGKWIGISQASAKEVIGPMMKQMGVSNLEDMATSTAKADEGSLEKLLEKHATFVYGEKDDYGKRIDATVKTKPFMEEASKSLPQGQKPDLSSVKDGDTFVVSAWTKGGKASRLSMPMKELSLLFGPAASSSPQAKPLPDFAIPGNLVVAFEDSAKITEPLNPTRVPASEVKQLLQLP